MPQQPKIILVPIKETVMHATLRILIADPYPVEREGLRVILERQEHWRVVGEAHNGNEMLTLFR